MQLDLNKCWFSCYGSYLSLGYCTKIRQFGYPEEGLYLRNLHGGEKMPSNQFRVRLLRDGQEVAAQMSATPSCFTLREGDARCDFAFANPTTLALRLRGAGVQLRLDVCVSVSDIFGYNAFHDGSEYCTVNMCSNSVKYVTAVCGGRLELLQDWNGSETAWLSLLYSTDADTDCIGYIEEVEAEWKPHTCSLDFDAAVAEREAEYRAFLADMPQVRLQYQPQRELASYILWSGYVQKRGILTRDAMYMSKNWMNSIWSWDNCFNSLALSHKRPQAALDQFLLLFDYQHESGVIPDYVNDLFFFYNFSKPPVHGLTLGVLLERMELSNDVLTDIFDKLGGWTQWWLTYRDSDNDGVCEYRHGNDCGWDNSTVFTELPPIESPDLQTYLILQCDMLAELAHRLGRTDDAAQWKQRSEALLEAMLTHSFVDNLPVARQSVTQRVVTSDSAILFTPLLLGDRLPHACTAAMLDKLRSGNYRTQFGCATEPLDSPYYESDGYWRGPIWAPQTYLLVRGLLASGEQALALELADSFSQMCAKSGFAENYDAVTGEGLRDPAYTWTSSVFLELEHWILTESEG